MREILFIMSKISKTNFLCLFKNISRLLVLLFHVWISFIWPVRHLILVNLQGSHTYTSANECNSTKEEIHSKMSAAQGASIGMRTCDQPIRMTFWRAKQPPPSDSRVLIVRHLENWNVLTILTAMKAPAGYRMMSNHFFKVLDRKNLGKPVGHEQYAFQHLFLRNIGSGSK